MGCQFYFITHPNVVVSSDVPVPRWPLSELGRSRMHRGLQLPWMRALEAIYCSTEQKAIDGAFILGSHLALPVVEMEALGENDRSATGFLRPDEFERMADLFFANPAASVRGWECAQDAQARVVRAVGQIARTHKEARAVAIVSHGAVGTLLYCHLAGLAIARNWDQPPNGGGNYFGFEMFPPLVRDHWQPVDE